MGVMICLGQGSLHSLSASSLVFVPSSSKYEPSLSTRLIGFHMPNLGANEYSVAMDEQH